MELIDSELMIKPEVNKFVFAVNRTGYVGLVVWTGIEWQDVKRAKVYEAFYWIKEGQRNHCCSGITINRNPAWKD